MKFFDVVLISLSVTFIIIGVHQSFIFGIGNSYWIFMLTLVLLLWYKIRNSGKQDEGIVAKGAKHKNLYRKKVKGK